MKTLEIKNLGKRYTITHRREYAPGYYTLRDTLADAVKRLGTKAFGRSMTKSPEKEEIWALKDVCMDVDRGEKVGIIGRNGAGKTTLLKVLSRITEPSEGYALIKGRVSSLLEVGTGFHPELTGRENIYLNGAVLGMKKAEIGKKFDEIVDFSGVEKFLDTPVKRYSSGMQVRLAFSVAAHLEPEILLVDEVLAVGDSEFQKRCLGKMDEVSKEQGRTIIFVSHNMAAIQALCSRAVYLQNGVVAGDGKVEEVIEKYIGSVERIASETPLAERTDRKGGDIFRFTKVEFLDAKTRKPLPIIFSGQDVLIRLYYRIQNTEELNNVMVGIYFFTIEGRYLFGCSSSVLNISYTLRDSQGYVACRIPRWPLTNGRYIYNLTARRSKQNLDMIKDAGFATVETGDYYGTGKIHAESRQGVLIDFKWHTGNEE